MRFFFSSTKKSRCGIETYKLGYFFFLSFLVADIQNIYCQEEITNADPWARIVCPSASLVGTSTNFKFCYDNRVSIMFLIK